MMLAEAVNNCRVGPLKNFNMNDKDRYELKIAGLLHDCGKVTTPVHVVDKATKLHTIFDRIALVDTRFEVIKRDAEIACLKAKIAAHEKNDRQAANAAGGNWNCSCAASKKIASSCASPTWAAKR